MPNLTHIIVISNKFASKKINEFKGKNNQVKVLLMEELESLGKSNKISNKTFSF